VSILVTSIIILACAAVASFVTWLLSKSRATAAEAKVSELRQQIEIAAKDFGTIRERLTTAEILQAKAETKAEETQKHLQEQLALLDDAKTKLADTFTSLASEALTKNNKDFLSLADQSFKVLEKGAQTELEARKAAIAELILPLSESLNKYQKESTHLEEKRQKDYGTVNEQYRTLAEGVSKLQNETFKLSSALKSPTVRGRWGEIALRRTVELAGMSNHCDFIEQGSVATEDGRLRPDMVVNLPAGRQIIVDSKVPLSAFQEALEAQTDEARKSSLVRYAQQIKVHVSKLAAKDYASQYPASAGFVVMFIPNDSFLSAAAEQDPLLIESALAQGIVITTPTTLIALFRAVEMGWRQESLAKNAQEISRLGQDLHDRFATAFDHFGQVGKYLDSAVGSFNLSVRSFESRLFPAARKFKELGASGKKEIPELAQIGQTPLKLENISAVEPVTLELIPDKINGDRLH